MINISNNGIITMDFGDSLSFPIFINAGSFLNQIEYQLLNNNTLLLQIINPKLEPENQIIISKKCTKKDLDSNSLVLNLTDIDLAKLISGTYYYTLKLIIYKNNKQNITTIKPRTKLIVL